jgi:hypothetical protein
VNFEEVCGEAEQPMDPVSGEEFFQSDPPRVKESAESKCPKKRVTPVSACGSVVPGKKVKCEEVCGEAELPVDPVSRTEDFQSDAPRVKESADSGRSSSEKCIGMGRPCVS